MDVPAPRIVEEIPGSNKLVPQEDSFERLVEHSADVSVSNDVPVRPVTQGTAEVPQHVEKIACTVVIHDWRCTRHGRQGRKERTWRRSSGARASFSPP